MDILTNEIREILARIRDLKALAILYSAEETIGCCVRENLEDLLQLLDKKLEENCTKQLKIQKEMSKLGTQEDMFD